VINDSVNIFRALARSKWGFVACYGGTENACCRVIVILRATVKTMEEKRLRAQVTKSKDVTPRENASRGRAPRKSAEMLPKILRLAGANGSLHTQRVRCGKANCKCARGELHEGYHYFFSRIGGRQFKVYVRREDVAAIRAVIEMRRHTRATWRSEIREASALLRRLLSAAAGMRL
jgi:hypothetical protein